MVGSEGGFWDGEVKEVERGDRKREEDENVEKTRNGGGWGEGRS